MAAKLSKVEAEIESNFLMQSEGTNGKKAHVLYSPSSLLKYGKKSNTPVFSDPYTSEMKARFEDAWRAEPIVRNAINVKVAFIMGESSKVGVTNQIVIDDEEEAAKALDAIMNKSEVKEYKARFEKINHRVKWHERNTAAVAQSMVYGRSVLGIQFKTYEGKEEPEALRLLNSTKLGRVMLKEIDEEGNADYVIDKVLYNEKPFDKTGIPSTSMLYYPNLDYHVSPNTLFYGYSDIEPIAHLAETNRVINEVVLPEINRSLWAGNLVISAETRDRSVLQDFLNKLDPGKPIGKNKTMTIEALKIEHDLDKLVNERNENDKRILRALRVPSFLMGFEDVTNRATSSAVLHAWNVSELKSKRQWLSNIVDQQWYDSLLIGFLGGDPEVFDKLEYRFRHEYQEIIFDEFADKTDAVIKLFQAKIIPLEKALEILGFRDVLKEAEALQEEQKKLDEENNAMKIEAMKQGNPNADKPAPGKFGNQKGEE